MKALIFLFLIVGVVVSGVGQTINDNMVKRPSFSTSPVWGNPEQFRPPQPKAPPPSHAPYRPPGSYDPFNPREQQKPVLQPTNSQQITKSLYPEIGTKPPTQEEIQQEFWQLRQYKGEDYNKRAMTYLRELYEDFRQGGVTRCPIKPILAQTTAYKNARQEIVAMLEGKTPPSLKRAVFVVENAFNNRLSWNEYDSLIQQGVRTVKSLVKEPSNQKDVHTALIRYWRETTIDPLTKKQHLPIYYDFEDYWGEKDYSKMFVSKLLKTNKGQCHSLPLLYKILANELGAESAIAFAPMHSYIQHKDEQGNWLHLELTNIRYVNSSTYAQTGYVKANTVKSGMYLNPLTEQQTLIYVLSDLLCQYERFHPNDPENFILETCELAKKYYPNFYRLRLLEANVHTNRFHYEMKKANYTRVDQIENNPYYMRFYNNMIRAYNKVDEVGYEVIPIEIYDRWIHSLV